jgi:hypothetical protein
MERPTRGEAAEDLREQAASCRRLARRARTAGGSSALATVADQFDDDARRIDPSSQRHWAPGEAE